MKKFVFALLLSFITLVSAFANSPQSIGFQAIVRDAYGQLVADTPVGVHVIILRNNIEVVYEEERVVTSNSQGLLSFAIGDGNATTANSIENVDWSNGSFAIRCEMDLNGGTTYTVTQTTPLTSVPFAFYAQKVAPSALPEWVNSAEKPTYDYSEITGTPKIPTKLSELENDLFPTIAVTEKDEASTSNPIITFDSLESKEADPVFAASLAAGITAEDTARW
ncbi:MAG: hypothetical protein MJZ23_10640, partial [Paludibacteraceae bacterium]|nr:hypothetical protein [Paludibacteraceae bacterium]